MTAFLASVMSAAEAETALLAGADIIDLKDPRRGALGALPTATIRSAVEQVAGRRPVSATAGDLPMEPETVADAALRIAALGVDFVKVGLWPGGELVWTLDALETRAARNFRLVAVLFADLDPDFELVRDLGRRGFAGVMLDTADKSGGGLRARMTDQRLADFVRRARAAGLFTGLAGSLHPDDIAPLLGLQPDYLGFRGALTGSGRTARLDAAAVAAVRRRIPVSEPGYQPSSASRATETAGAQVAARSRP